MSDEKIQDMIIMKTSEILKDCKLPDFQRLRHEDRVNELYQSIYNTLSSAKKKLRMPGCLVISINAKTGEKNLLDGNHRVGAAKILFEKDGTELYFYVNVQYVESNEESLEVFNMVNNCMPIPEIPKGTTLAEPNKVINYFKNKYVSECFSSSLRPKRPQVSENIFTKVIAKVINEKKITSNYVIETLEIMNTVISQQEDLTNFQKNSKDNIGSIKNMFETCKSRGFYLGMFDSKNLSQHIYDLFEVQNTEE